MGRMKGSKRTFRFDIGADEMARGGSHDLTEKITIERSTSFLNWIELSVAAAGVYTSMEIDPVDMVKLARDLKLALDEAGSSCEFYILFVLGDFDAGDWWEGHMGVSFNHKTGLRVVAEATAVIDDIRNNPLTLRAFRKRLTYGSKKDATKVAPTKRDKQ